MATHRKLLTRQEFEAWLKSEGFGTDRVWRRACLRYVDTHNITSINTEMVLEAVMEEMHSNLAHILPPLPSF